MTVFRKFAKQVQQVYNHELKLQNKYSVKFTQERSKAYWTIRWTNYKEPVQPEDERRSSARRNCCYR